MHTFFASGRALLVGAASLALALSATQEAAGQRVRRIPTALIQEVMPGADRFAEVSGDPPVVRGFTSAPDGTETLYGYVFLTSDLPPEQYGYSGPIEALVGMRLDGTLTGVRVTDYQESYMRSMGDFLRTPGFQEQFAGKYLGDPFQLWNDIEGISRVSISVRAMSRGVRDSARRVANAYGLTSAVAEVGGEVVDPVGRSWFELRQLGVVQRFEVTEPGEGSAGIALAHIANDRVGEYFFGQQLYERAVRSAERRGGADNLVLYAIDGSRLRLFKQQGWSIVQDNDTTAIESRNVIGLGLPSGGVVSGEATMVGIMLVDSTVDMSRPLSFVYDLGELGIETVEYVSQEARLVMAEEAAAAAAAERAEPEGEPEAESPLEPAPAAEAPVAGAPVAGAPVAGTPSVATPNPAVEEPTPAAPTVTPLPDAAPAEPAAPETSPDPVAASAPVVEGQELDFTLTEDESLLERTLADTSWARVGMMVIVLTLGSLAFFTKAVLLRWLALGMTLVVLGFVDGGFLSVSHITSGIWAGAGVYLRDLPLLLMVAFTLVTTLIWGRVFCGFLCPFGALQDFIDRVAPSSWKRPLPQPIHDKAIYAKYGVLALIVIPALAGSRVSLYQYFEPFGTVFFRSPSLVLWLIAGAFLAASVVIPRFYCRYACPSERHSPCSPSSR